MKNKFILATAAVAFAGLSACAQQEEPAPMVMPEPTYDKYGNVVHHSGTHHEWQEHHHKTTGDEG